MTVYVLLCCLAFDFTFFTQENAWKSFVENPNLGNYTVCKEQINQALSQGKKGIMPSFKQLYEESIGDLLRLVENGNELSADLCFQLYPIFKGHVDYLEFFDISLGMYLKKNPKGFLSLVQKYTKTNKPGAYRYDIKSMIGNYGDAFVDKWDQQVIETDARIAALNSVNEKQYEEIKSFCVQYLTEEKADLENTRDFVKNREQSIKK